MIITIISVNIFIINLVVLYLLYKTHSEKIHRAKLKKRLHGIIPEKGSDESAGYDLYACIDDSIEIAPQQTVLIGTGVSITPPKGYFGAIFARSGLATKKGLRPANCVGVADWDYTGEYMVALHNDSTETQIINPRDRIAQLVFLPYISVEFNMVEYLEQTERGEGGFGHTGR